jgi:hypothetical protein
MNRDALIASGIAVCAAASMSTLVITFGWSLALQIFVFFLLGLGGGWFFVLPAVEWLAGPRVALLAVLATGIAFAFMVATGTLPWVSGIEDGACHDRQGAHRC